jgi:hypothetical protein
MPPQDRPVDGTRNLIGQQANEAQKGLRRIIEIWERFRSDSEPAIRILTLVATVIGFVLLLMFLVLCIDCGVSLPFGKAVHFEWYLLYLTVCLLAFLGVAIPVAVRVSARAPAVALADGFESIFAQKYGTPR